jgi:oxygen-independent coproporphyrinogen-3 oxidase
MMMGLRLKDGLDLRQKQYSLAYQYFRPKLKGVKIKNNFLIAENINLLDNILIELL